MGFHLVYSRFDPAFAEPPKRSSPQQTTRPCEIAAMAPELAQTESTSESSGGLQRPDKIFGFCFFPFCFGLFFFHFSSGPVKCRILQHFLAKLTHFTLAHQHPQHRFQHPPHVRPTSLASPTNQVAGGLTGSKK